MRENKTLCFEMDDDEFSREDDEFTVSAEQNSALDSSSNGNILFKKEVFSDVVEMLSKVYGSVPRKIMKMKINRRDFGKAVNDDSEAVGANLPVNVVLHIFSYIDVISLCNVSQVCRSWNNIANDNLLWEQKLKNDANLWERIDHLSHPKLHRDTNPELKAKDIYLQCCPECRKHRKSLSFPTQLPKLSYYFGFKIPRIVMFGSGLDSSGLVKRVLWDKRSPFTVKGMFPGQFEGIGSGVTMQYTGGTMNLICLYALYRAERQMEEANQRRSRLLADGQEISQPVKELCLTVDAFIYIVDGTTEDKVQFRSEEFKAMIDDRWLQPQAPVLVLCIVPNATVNSVSSLEVVNKLNLLNLTRPWQVRQCHVNSLYGFLPGVTWLNNHVMGI